MLSGQASIMTCYKGLPLGEHTDASYYITPQLEMETWIGSFPTIGNGLQTLSKTCIKDEFLSGWTSESGGV